MGRSNESMGSNTAKLKKIIQGGEPMKTIIAIVIIIAIATAADYYLMNKSYPVDQTMTSQIKF